MDASVDGVEGFYEDELDTYGESQQIYPQRPQSIATMERQSSSTNNYGRQSSTSSSEHQHWAHRPPGRTTSNDSNDGIEQYWVDTDMESLSQHLPLTAQVLPRGAGERWPRHHNDIGREVTHVDSEHLSRLDQEVMELAVRRSMEGEFY
jgi:hypothetical protein